MRADCIFTDWGGMLPPLRLTSRGLVSIRDSAFRNAHLRTELVDVSIGGTALFSNVSLVNVELARGAVVGTTHTDQTLMPECDHEYHEDDDEGYDVAVAAVTAAERSVLGEDFVIADGAMSDCLFPRALDGVALPGCPRTSVAARRRRAGLCNFSGDVQYEADRRACEVQSTGGGGTRVCCTETLSAFQKGAHIHATWPQAMNTSIPDVRCACIHLHAIDFAYACHRLCIVRKAPVREPENLAPWKLRLDTDVRMATYT